MSCFVPQCLSEHEMTLTNLRCIMLEIGSIVFGQEKSASAESQETEDDSDSDTHSDTITVTVIF